MHELEERVEKVEEALKHKLEGALLPRSIAPLEYRLAELENALAELEKKMSDMLDATIKAVHT